MWSCRCVLLSHLLVCSGRRWSLSARRSSGRRPPVRGWRYGGPRRSPENTKTMSDAERRLNRGNERLSLIQHFSKGAFESQPRVCLRVASDRQRLITDSDRHSGLSCWSQSLTRCYVRRRVGLLSSALRWGQQVLRRGWRRWRSPRRPPRPRCWSLVPSLLCEAPPSSAPCRKKNTAAVNHLKSCEQGPTQTLQVCVMTGGWRV